MSGHPLDHAVLNALTTRQSGLAMSHGGVLRFEPDHALFAAAYPGTPARDWVELARTTGPLAMFEPGALVPAGLTETGRIDCLQMICSQLRAGGGTMAYDQLGDADGPEMLALATLTQPGPFFSRTHRLGSFIGIREGGRLIAMAGERLKLEGFSEVSGVCTHPDRRGLGYAGVLMRAVTQRILDDGQVAFLHVRESNTATIAFYQTLGFEPRTSSSYIVMEPAAGVQERDAGGGEAPSHATRPLPRG
jgi:hypothetical protein